jgi:hypothetical protein
MLAEYVKQDLDEVPVLQKQGKQLAQVFSMAPGLAIPYIPS